MKSEYRKFWNAWSKRYEISFEVYAERMVAQLAKFDGHVDYLKGHRQPTEQEVKQFMWETTTTPASGPRLRRSARC